jgi:hypothetical protein
MKYESNVGWFYEMLKKICNGYIIIAKSMFWILVDQNVICNGLCHIKAVKNWYSFTWMDFPLNKSFKYKLDLLLINNYSQ